MKDSAPCIGEVFSGMKFLRETVKWKFVEFHALHFLVLQMFSHSECVINKSLKYAVTGCYTFLRAWFWSGSNSVAEINLDLV